MLKNSQLKIFLWITDISVFTLIFTLLNYQKFTQLIPTGNYLYLFISYLFFRVFFSYYYNRIDEIFNNSLVLSLRIIFWSSLVNFLFVIITISFSDLWSISRIFILGFTTILFIYDLIFTLIIRLITRLFNKNTKINNKTNIQTKRKFYISWLLPLAILLIFFYAFVSHITNGYFIYNSDTTAFAIPPVPRTKI